MFVITFCTLLCSMASDALRILLVILAIGGVISVVGFGMRLDAIAKRYTLL